MSRTYGDPNNDPCAAGCGRPRVSNRELTCGDEACLQALYPGTIERPSCEVCNTPWVADATRWVADCDCAGNDERPTVERFREPSHV